MLFGGDVYSAYLSIDERTNLLGRSRRENWGTGGLPPGKFVKTMPSRVSESALFEINFKYERY